MYLKNNLIEHNICNGTVGVILDINLDPLQVRIAFSVMGEIVDIGIKKKHLHFL